MSVLKLSITELVLHIESLWAHPVCSSPEELAWESRKYVIASSIVALLRELIETGFVKDNITHFIDCLELDHLWWFTEVEWLNSSHRKILSDYAQSLPDFSVLTQTQLQSVVEKHEWMRFEIASELLKSMSWPHDLVSIERMSRYFNRKCIPKSRAALLSCEEYSFLSLCIPLSKYKTEHRGRL